MADLLEQLKETPRSVYLPTVICAATVLVFYKYYVNYYNYWSSRGLKGWRPFFVVGEIYNFFAYDRMKSITEATKKYGKVWGTFMLGNPRIVVADAEVVRQICIKDFDCFVNHRPTRWSNQYQQNFLVWLNDNHWKRVRALMTPTFTSGKIKRMFKLLDRCAEDLVDNFREQCLGGGGTKNAANVDLFKTYSMYTMDGITSCCYSLNLAREKLRTESRSPSTTGSSRNSLVEDCGKVFGFKLVRFMTSALVPKFILEAVKFEMEPVHTWRGLVRRLEILIGQRRAAGKGRHEDLLQMLVDAKMDDEMEVSESDRAEDHHAELSKETQEQAQKNLKLSLLKESNGTQLDLTDLEIISNAILILVAGLDTTRSSLSTITYFLAHNKHVQERLFREIKQIAKYEETAMGKRVVFNYDDIVACSYLDATISECLRMLAPAPFTDRVANKDYYIEKYGLTIKKDEQIVLGFHAMHQNPEYWPEPEKFDPERFMPENREKIVPGSYAPFSLGPRHCIGMRFSLIETKLGLAKALMHFEFSPAPNTEYPPKASMGLGLVTIKNCLVGVKMRDCQ